MKNEFVYEIKLEKEWIDALDKAFKKKNKETKIDGFRKGSAPKEVFIKKFGIESLYMDSINEVVNVAYKKLLEEHKDLKPVIEPIVDVTGVSDSNVIFKFTIITKPEVKLGEWKKLGIKKDKITVSEEEIKTELNKRRDQMADLVVQDKNKKIANGITAVIDFEGFVDGKSIEGGKGENYPLEIGSHSFIPGFEEGLIGLKTGDKKELKLKFPENYTEELKNKDVLFKVTINEVKERVLPEINEDFFKDLGYEDIKTEKELKDKIKEELTKDKEHVNDEKFIDECLEKASKNMKVEINSEIITEEVHRMLDQFAYQLQMQGMNIDTYYQMTGSKKEDLENQMKPEAEKRVKYRYLIEAIADEEKIDFTEKEVNKKAEEMAKEYGITVEELLKDFGSTDIVKYDMKMHKALELLKENN